MNDLFAPPGDDWRPVSPQLCKMRRVVLLTTTGILLIAVIVIFLVFDLPGWLMGLSLGAVLAFAVLAWAMIGRSSRAWGYAERDEDLYIKHGAMFRELIVVPYGRMQFVDINSGPIERAYGIASVHLHTASPGTSARIPGLPADEAARLRDRLTSLGEAQAAGL
ncbi:MAG TPA: PH domain-containing protein [Nocardioidaceae bacterium]|nr:PH domain-containing protein [Nocardioidaceae bacterium]